MITEVKAYFLLVVMAVVFVGCSTIQSGLDMVSGTDARILWQGATAQVISEGYVDAPELLSQIEDAEKYLDGETSATIGTMTAVLRNRLAKSDKPIGVKIVLGEIITRYEQRLEERIGAGALNPDQKLQVKTVLGWIRSAAQMYGGIQE